MTSGQEHTRQSLRFHVWLWHQCCQDGVTRRGAPACPLSFFASPQYSPMQHLSTLAGSLVPCEQDSPGTSKASLRALLLQDEEKCEVTSSGALLSACSTVPECLREDTAHQRPQRPCAGKAEEVQGQHFCCCVPDRAGDLLNNRQVEEAAHQRAKASLMAFLQKNEENKAAKAAAAQRAKQEDLRLLTLNEHVEGARDAVRRQREQHTCDGSCELAGCWTHFPHCERIGLPRRERLQPCTKASTTKKQMWQSACIEFQDSRPINSLKERHVQACRDLAAHTRSEPSCTRVSSRTRASP